MPDVLWFGGGLVLLGVLACGLGAATLFARRAALASADTRVMVDDLQDEYTRQIANLQAALEAANAAAADAKQAVADQRALEAATLRRQWKQQGDYNRRMAEWGAQLSVLYLATLEQNAAARRLLGQQPNGKDLLAMLPGAPGGGLPPTPTPPWLGLDGPI